MNSQDRVAPEVLAVALTLTGPGDGCGFSMSPSDANTLAFKSRPGCRMLTVYIAKITIAPSNTSKRVSSFVGMRAKEYLLK